VLSGSHSRAQLHILGFNGEAATLDAGDLLTDVLAHFWCQLLLCADCDIDFKVGMGFRVILLGLHQLAGDASLDVHPHQQVRHGRRTVRVGALQSGIDSCSAMILTEQCTSGLRTGIASCDWNRTLVDTPQKKTRQLPPSTAGAGYEGGVERSPADEQQRKEGKQGHCDTHEDHGPFEDSPHGAASLDGLLAERVGHLLQRAVRRRQRTGVSSDFSRWRTCGERHISRSPSEAACRSLISGAWMAAWGLPATRKPIR